MKTSESMGLINSLMGRIGRDVDLCIQIESGGVVTQLAITGIVAVVSIGFDPRYMDPGNTDVHHADRIVIQAKGN